MQTAEVKMVEVVKTSLNGESLNGVVAGSGLAIAGISIAILTGGMTIDFPTGAKGLVPMLGILIGMTSLFYFFMKSHLVSVTKEMQKIRTQSKPAPSSTLDEAPLDAEIEDAALEQSTTRGEVSIPVAATPVAPKPGSGPD